MKNAPTFRQARDEDIRAAYAVFRRSLFAYLHRIGLVTAEEAANPTIDSSWKRQAAWIGHFWASAAENWVATDEDDAVIGWALSVARGGHLELSFFFVDPNCSLKGVGSRLLELAFTSRPETHKTIMATQDPAALSLYLRAGVHFVTTSCDVCVCGQPRPPHSGLDLRPIEGFAAEIAMIADIEARTIGLRRDEDIRFLVSNRPGWIALRDGTPVGYAFGAEPAPQGATDFPPTCGPLAAISPADLPALIDHVIGAAPADTDLYFSVPMTNPQALDHLLRLGGKIDPFYIAVLSSTPEMALDGYIHTAPSFIL